jgi:hypothetical protein
MAARWPVHALVAIVQERIAQEYLALAPRVDGSQAARRKAVEGKVIICDHRALPLDKGGALALAKLEDAVLEPAPRAVSTSIPGIG